MPNIKVLDSVAIPADQRRAAEQAQKEREQKYSSAPTADNLTPVNNYVTIDLGFRVLKNIEGGRYLIPDENCNIELEKLDAIDEEHKSSSYWISYHKHFGTEVISQKKTYIQHFQVEDNAEKPGSSIAKTDMDYKLRIEEIPSTELRDWLFNDLIVTLWESRPVFAKVRDETTEIESDKVVINEETELPEIETINRGIIKINFYDWLKKSPETPTYSSSQKKADKAQAAANAANPSNEATHCFFNFYSTSMMDVAEFKVENKRDKFKDKDVDFMVEHLVERETEEARVKAEKEAEALAAAQAAAGGGAKGKADPKKDPKAQVKGGAKGAAPVDDKNAPQPITVEYEEIGENPNYVIYEKAYRGPKAVESKAGAKKDKAGTATKENKNKQRKDEVVKTYNIIRSLPYSLAVDVKLNYEEPAEVEEPEPVKAPTPVDTKPAKGKK